MCVAFRCEIFDNLARVVQGQANGKISSEYVFGKLDLFELFDEIEIGLLHWAEPGSPILMQSDDRDCSKQATALTEPGAFVFPSVAVQDVLLSGE